MLKVLRERYDRWPNVDIEARDLRDGLPRRPQVVLIQSVLTLQFTPIEHRQRIVHEIYKALAPGGAFILVEKVLGDTAPVDEMLVDRYLGMKRAAGYSEDEIRKKQLALEGTLVPVTAAWNADLLRRAGFTQVDSFWRALNFAAWVAVKGD